MATGEPRPPTSERTTSVPRCRTGAWRDTTHRWRHGLIVASLVFGSACADAARDGSGRAEVDDEPNASLLPASPRPAAEPLIPMLPPMTTSPVPTTIAPGESKVLFVGDSTMLAIRRYAALGALRGFNVTYDAESCRTLGVPSCGVEPKPPNTVEAIAAANGPFDIVVVMAGYDEWWTSFPTSFDEVIAVSRAQGAEHIVWLTFREGVGYTAPDGSTANEAFVENNRTLLEQAASGRYPDLVLADWYGYTTPPGDWLANDGIHITEPGAFGLADYLSRFVAFVDGRPCAMPLVAGGPIESPCPNPDSHPRPPDIRSLYP